MIPSLVVTLLVGTSPPEDFDSVPLVVEGVSVVREAPRLLLEDMGRDEGRTEITESDWQVDSLRDEIRNR